MIGLKGSHLMGHTLPWRPLTQEILHGSVPLAFNIFTNSLQSVPSCEICKGHQTRRKRQTLENIFEEKYNAGKQN